MAFRSSSFVAFSTSHLGGRLCSFNCELPLAPARGQSIVNFCLHALWPIRTSRQTCANSDEWSLVMPMRPNANSIHTAFRHAFTSTHRATSLTRWIFGYRAIFLCVDWSTAGKCYKSICYAGLHRPIWFDSFLPFLQASQPCLDPILHEKFWFHPLYSSLSFSSSFSLW